VQGSLIGVGPALKKARVRRGVTIDEASRSTRIRPDFIDALEREEFDSLLGEVYVRGALRSYASFLGLDSEKVLAAYADHDDTPDLASPEPPTQIQTTIGVERRRDSHRLAIAVVVILAILAAGFGILSSRGSAPAPAELPASPGQAAVPAASTVIVGVSALERVEVTYVADGVEQTVMMRAGETRTFEADELLEIRLDPGGIAEVTVNGEPLGVPGREGRPWRDTFAPTSEAPPTPVGTATAVQGEQEGSSSPGA